MGCCLKILGLGCVLFAIGIGFLWQKLNEIPQVPDLKLEYWAAGPSKPDDKSIKPFTINFPKSVLIDLKTRLNNTRSLTKPLEGVGFQYGFNTIYLSKLLQFWKEEYKWEERQALFNKLPQFKTQISGLNIHFIHLKPDKPQGKVVLPLLLLHGWPETVLTSHSLLPLLTSSRPDADFVFEVIVPSLPGYGFSDGAGQPGLGPPQIGVIFHELMTRLGFQHYYIQGGDWGAFIGRTMSVLYPESVSGYHSHMCASNTRKGMLQLVLAYMFPSLFVPENRLEQFKSQFPDLPLEAGYFLLQSTKPDTVGVALSDSPAGLAAYILEKYSTWTNKAWRNLEDGGLEKFDKAALIDTIMIYWLTNSITTSVRLYAEAFHIKTQELKLDQIPVTIPTGCAVFRHDLLYHPPSMIETSFLDLVQITEIPKGGHFAPFEVPDILADDVFNFVKKLRKRMKNQKP